MNKTLSLPAVKYAALLLLEANGSTTTLDVKNLLRSLGFWTLQSEVSVLMDAASADLPLEYANSGRGYRVYSMPDAATVATSVDDEDEDDEATETEDDLSISPKLLQASRAFYLGRKGELVYLFDSVNEIINNGGTPVRQSVGGGKTLYYAQNVRRDLARSAHAAFMKMDYNDIRSSSLIA